MAPKVEGPKTAPIRKPRTMLMMARMIVPAQYLARLMRPSNDVKRYCKSKFIVPPPFAAGLRQPTLFVRPNGSFAEEAICSPPKSIPEQFVDRGLGPGALIHGLDDHRAIERR